VTTVSRKTATICLALAVIVFIYLFGVGVILSPALQFKDGIALASDLSGSIGRELPYALAWPVRLVHALKASGGGINASLRGSLPPDGQ
jgi:hypothetical protein